MDSNTYTSYPDQDLDMDLTEFYHNDEFMNMDVGECEKRDVLFHLATGGNLTGYNSNLSEYSQDIPYVNDHEDYTEGEETFTNNLETSFEGLNEDLIGKTNTTNSHNQYGGGNFTDEPRCYPGYMELFINPFYDICEESINEVLEMNLDNMGANIVDYNSIANGQKDLTLMDIEGHTRGKLKT